ncbi:MAG: plectin 1 isoform 8, partial [Deltaproteobacteria bacterium]|nr:plectin 1 isoform 8 [Deltaproteobacteria bacterium]
MSAAFRALGPSELLPRYVFAEPLLVRRRVLEVGAVASTGGESARFLRTRGARAVVACDDDVAAVTAAAAANEDAALRFRACVFEDLAPHSFDLLLVADLAPYVRAPGLLGALLRLRAPHGVLLGGLRNPAGFALSRLGALEGGEVPPTFGQALDALSAHLPSVEVATQAPVLGYQVAFERGDGLQVDGTLAGEGEAAYFVLVAGEGPVQGCEPVWVQLPPEPLAFAGGRLEAQEGRARQEQARARALAEALEAVRGELNALAAREQAQGQALASAR